MDSKRSIAPAAIDRLAEFFEGSLESVYAFIGTAWLPHARESAARLVEAIAAKDSPRALFMTDHVREGARCVGAAFVVERCTKIERSLHSAHWSQAGADSEQLRVDLARFSFAA